MYAEEHDLSMIWLLIHIPQDPKAARMYLFVVAKTSITTRTQWITLSIALEPLSTVL